MHRLWSDGRWNKLTVAHGCYWKKCTFCDVTLDYIGRYDPLAADLLVDRIEALVDETGQTGFHFVDEAAPPAACARSPSACSARHVITWWGNIRFEKTFTPELAALLARSGCVAVSGGLEVASDRLLALMKKGVTVAQVARVTRAFTDAGIMVHAYLMYGFPTETQQETIDALERVRQLFDAGCIQSAFWHRFAATAHSPIGLRPELYGIRLRPEPPATFARNELPFEDPVGCDHERLGRRPAQGRLQLHARHRPRRRRADVVRGADAEGDQRLDGPAESPRQAGAPPALARGAARPHSQGAPRPVTPGPGTGQSPRPPNE